jgi:hypothetical protein
MFNEGGTSVHNEERSRCPSHITEDLRNKIDQHIRTNRCFTLDEILEKFPHISQLLIYEIVTEHLHYKKICAKWAPRMLTEEHKSKHMGAALTFLECYHQESNTFFGPDSHRR